MLPTLIVDVAVPIVVFNLLIRYGVPILWALIPGGLAPAINNIRVWIRSGRLEPLGIIVIMFLVVGTVASLISGNIFFVLIKESFLTGTFGLICLGSLLFGRPLMFYVNRQFVAGDDPDRLAWWNGLVAIRRFSRGIACRDRGVGYRLSHRGSGPGRLRARADAGAGGGDLARDGIRRADRAHRLEPALYAGAAGAAVTGGGARSGLRGGTGRSGTV